MQHETSRDLLTRLLGPRLEPRAHSWFEGAQAELAAGADADRFCALLSQASRFAGRGPLLPTEAERAAAAEALAAWNIERWSRLEAMRVALILARTDLDQASGVAAIEEAFRYADEGELCALYKSLAHLPDGGRFAWRAAEGCRTNMTTVFESVACDTPYPAANFDEVAWKQMLLKSAFIGAPLWRVVGLDDRLSEDLARMALDLVDERRSAGRAIQPELWLCLGTHCKERALAALSIEVESERPVERQAAAVALARAGQDTYLAEKLETEHAPEVAATMRSALDGEYSQWVYRDLDPAIRN